MKALLDFLPDYCANCGRNIAMSDVNREEWTAFVEMMCRCGFEYQYAPANVLTTLANIYNAFGAGFHKDSDQ